MVMPAMNGDFCAITGLSLVGAGDSLSSGREMPCCRCNLRVSAVAVALMALEGNSEFAATCSMVPWPAGHSSVVEML